MQKLHFIKTELDDQIKALDNQIQEQEKETEQKVRNIDRRNERREELIQKCKDASDIFSREIRLVDKKKAESKRHQYHLKERQKMVEELEEVDR